MLSEFLLIAIANFEYNANFKTQNFFLFTEVIQKNNFIKKELYSEFVKNMPIPCIDVFVYNSTIESYLLIKRKQAPAKNEFWLPGGRIFKGESFFETAIRKCKEETGIDIVPKRILNVNTTIFPNSEWNCQTHSINIVIFAIYDKTNINLNDNHEDYIWMPIKDTNGNPYIELARKKFLKAKRNNK